METTSVFSRNAIAFSNGVRRIVNMGGTSGGKTFSELQLAYYIVKKRTKPTLISVVSESLPHLKKGAIADFEKIIKGENDYNVKNINQTDQEYYFGNNTVQFFSADIGKATGPRRDILIVNECNNIPYRIISELEMRTNEAIFYDFNPTADFWISNKVLNLPASEFVLIKSNYKDNPFLPDAIRKDIELKASLDPNFKKIHIDVEFGTYEGLIFPNINLVDEMPETDKQRYGMDFGFTNDPTTLIDVRINNGELWLDEMLYQTAMTNGDIIRYLKSIGIGRKEIVADSSEPKSIKEIELAGFNIKGAVKGEDSVRRGIDLIKTYKINVTKRSVNMIKEFRNYKWKIDKSGKSMNEPVDLWNHCIDPTRYSLTAMTDVVKRSPPRIM